MALDPNISLGVRPIQLVDPLAQYGQVAQIQAAQQSQQMNALRMQEVQRDIQEANAMRGLDLKDPEYRAKVYGISPTRGQAFDVAQTELASKKATTGKALEETAVMQRKAADDRLANLRINQSDENIIAHNQDIQLSNATPQEKAYADQRSKMILGLNPTQRKQFFDELGTTSGDRLSAQTTRLGQQSTAESARLGRLTTERGQNIGATTAQARLAFEQGKFAYEKANPGYELKEAEDGSIVGVNKRTLQAFPVSLGGGAGPAAAPVAGGVGGTGMPGARAAQPSVAPATLPGAEPTAAARPLMGKGTALTESQGNATAYGMRMFDSNKLLKDLETAGTTSGGRIRGAVEGTLTSLIPYQGANLAEGAGAIMNVLPGVLGGPNEQQQSYDAAKRNFITAVLRKESGAAIGASEFANEDKKYFPQAGESKKIIEQKQKARDLAIRAMKIQAGPGAKNIGVDGADGGTPSAIGADGGNVDTSNPLLR